ncbi:MAG: type 4a pilus biogenesis protein PilO [Pseudonocardiales bacterium]
MTKMHQWVAIAALAVVAILAAGWFIVISPQRSHAGQLHEQAAAQRSRTVGLRTQLSVLREQAKQLPAKQVELATFATQIPSTPALPSLVRSLNAAGTSAGVDLVSIAPGPPAALGAAGGAVAPPARTTPAATATNPGATTLAAAAPATALQSIPLVLKVNGTYPQLEQFLANLEGLQRVLLVSGYSISPSTGAVAATGTAHAAAARSCMTACLLDLDLTGQVFIAPALAAPAVPLTVK